MKLDPDAQDLLSRMETAGMRPYETMSVDGARQAFRLSRPIPAPERRGMARIEDLQVPVDGASIALRRYIPSSLDPVGAAPALLYFHGGGWVIGDLDCFDGICCRLADQGQCSVYALDYRLAPEFRFPTAVEDGRSALDWLRGSAEMLGLDARRLAIGGDSAGGGIAAALVSQGGGELGIPAQMLFYPCLDLTMSLSDRFCSALPLPFTPATMRWFRSLYLGERSEALDPRASPLLAPLQEGQPPAYILTCGADPLGAEGVCYAERLDQAGARVHHRHQAGQMHGLLGHPIATADAAIADAATFLREIFAHQGR